MRTARIKRTRVDARLQNCAPLRTLSYVTISAERVQWVKSSRVAVVVQFKAENHAHMMAIYFMHYNFVRIHQTLKITPATATGVTSRLWEMSDMVKVLEDWEASQS